MLVWEDEHPFFQLQQRQVHFRLLSPHFQLTETSRLRWMIDLVSNWMWLECWISNQHLLNSTGFICGAYLKSKICATRPAGKHSAAPAGFPSKGIKRAFSISSQGLCDAYFIRGKFSAMCHSGMWLSWSSNQEAYHIARKPFHKVN